MKIIVCLANIAVTNLSRLRSCKLLEKVVRMEEQLHSLTNITSSNGADLSSTVGRISIA